MNIVNKPIEGNPMQGNNSIILCLAEMKVAMQEYLNKRLGEYAPQIKNIKANTSEYTFELQLSDKE